MSLIGGLIVVSTIIGFNYGAYKLGMWSVRHRLVNTRELLLKQYPQDDILINEITNHIKEIDVFKSQKKNLNNSIKDERECLCSKND